MFFFHYKDTHHSSKEVVDPCLQGDIEPDPKTIIDGAETDVQGINKAE